MFITDVLKILRRRSRKRKMRKPKIKNDSLEPNLAVPKLEVVLYHWSPTANRRSIQRNGLMPGKLSLSGDWRPPYVALADEPLLAWFLSGRIWPEIKSWDLWMCYAENQTSFNGWEIILDTYRSGRTYVKEYRIYKRIYKRDLHYIGTREN